MTGEIETLKDLEQCGLVPCNREPPVHEMSVTSSNLRVEAMKWDIQDRAELLAGKKLTALDIINKWFIRLNLIEEDLQ